MATQKLAEACEFFMASKLSSSSAHSMDTQVLPGIVSQLNDTVDMGATIDIATSDSDEDCRGEFAGQWQRCKQLRPVAALIRMTPRSQRKNSPFAVIFGP